MTDRTRRAVLGGIGATIGLGVVGTAAAGGGRGRGNSGGRGGGGGSGNGGGGGDVRVGPDESIQAGVDAADPGDRVVVEGGTHREQVLVDKDLSLVGVDDPVVVPPSGRLANLSLLRPLIGVDGSDTAVDIEGFVVDGEDRGSRGFYTGVGYFQADGTVSDVTVRRSEYGAFVTQNLGGGGDQAVTVRDSRFADLGFQPLVFNERGTVGRAVGNTLVGTPGTTQYALTAGFGATATVRDNVFRDFYAQGGFGIGVFAFDSADNDVKRNRFENVQYPAYLLADSSSDFASSAGRTRVMRNTADGSGLPDGTTAYGTTVFANDPDTDDGTVESANNVKVVNNDYTGYTVGVGTYTVGEGEVENTKIVRNEFTDVGTAVDDNAERTKQQANRME